MATTQAKSSEDHTQDASQPGLPGEFIRPIKVTMLGAGSGFTSKIISDILHIRGLQGGTFALVDVDRKRLKIVERLIKLMLEERGITNWKVVASPDRRQVLPGTDYIVNSIEVSGTACVRHDNDIPLKYGIDQCIGDTIGPGGLFKGLRTIPVWLDILRDAEDLCPKVQVLNYTNPMNMLCLASGRISSLPVVGLCHSVQGTSALLARRAGVPVREMEWECAGINHLAWFTKLRHKGKDLYPKLMRMAKSDLAGKLVDKKDLDLVRKDMMLHFGAFITESSGHLSEYLPYYRTNRKTLKKYARAKYDGESGFYANNWPQWRKDRDVSVRDLLSGRKKMDWNRSWEYGSWIIEAREKNTPFIIHGNVMNTAPDGQGPLITNLPHDGCVEVACLVDRNGVQPTRYGKLPPQMAALCDSNMRMFELAATAAIERSKEAAIHALMLDPLTAAVCSPAEIKAMALELFAAEKKFLPGFK